MLRLAPASRSVASVVALFALAFGAPACGGGGGDTNATGRVALISFLQAGITNAPLNQILEFRFSEPIDKDSITTATLQVREGPDFGLTVFGAYRVSGSSVFFEPVLPGVCDLSDGGFKPATTYRVTLVGFPETFCLKQDDGVSGSTNGDPLSSTLNYEFSTRAGDDPLLFTDQIAAAAPKVTQCTPSNGTPVVQVLAGNQVVIQLSENVNPCTVSTATVLFEEYQRGDLNVFNVHASGRSSGFTPVDDADLGNIFSWGPISGAEVQLPVPQRILSTIALVQSFSGTKITITPAYGRFPENALCVVQLTFGIKDFGGQSLVPFAAAFTTENLPAQADQYRVGWEGETPVLKDQTTGDVDTIRSPDRAQGWLLFAGDADNGSNQLTATGPNLPPACTTPRQVNDGNKDDFDPNTDVNFDTGLTVNTCLNKTDGSAAVVWEFRSFRLRSGRIVRMTGVNPAIILVQGDVLIESGARLLVKGDGANGSLNANGANGVADYALNPAGGSAAAGSGKGGNSHNPYTSNQKADDGSSGFGSTSPMGTVGGAGAGIGGSHATHATFTSGGSGYGGGGGGHSEVGLAGGTNAQPNSTYKTAVPPVGGGTYPAMDNRLLTPSAGSGGGGGGSQGYVQAQSFNGYDASGGAGGAGAGFLDLTSGGNINIFGILDASGGRGGNGSAGFYGAGAGGGGGSGGGIRLLTPNGINVNGATLTAAGGVAGSGAAPTGAAATIKNNGGTGGKGRLVMEDGDSVILNIGTAVTSPVEGDNGFNRGIFDPSRFKGGGLEPQVMSDVFLVGPTDPQFVNPLVTDFVASIPTGAERPPNGTAIFIEARGFDQKADGTADLTGMTLTVPAWRTVGYFKHSGVGSAPTWVANGTNPGDVAIPTGNSVGTIANLNGKEFLQLRVTFYLPNTAGPFDPGPILDDWIIRFTSNQ